MTDTFTFSRMARPISVCLSLGTAVALSLASAAAQSADERTGTEMFTGCNDQRILGRANNSPRETLMSAAGRKDPKSGLIFKSFSLDQAAEIEADEFDGECWSRLDGLWREQMRVSFDTEIEAVGWAAASPDLANLAHGMYTTPVYLQVDHDESGKRLQIRTALGSGDTIQFASSDGVTLSDVFTGQANSKTYSAEQAGRSAPKLVFDVSNRGYMRLKLGDRTFIRPKPEISETARSEQVGANDLFAIAYNPRNLRAVRQGYDVTRQDPGNFLDNGGLLYIFAPPKPRDYYISEQMTVPLGLQLIPEGNKQGMVYYESLLSNSYEYQKANSTSFGVNAGLTGKKGGPEGEKRYDPASASVGYQNARKQSESMSNKNSVATINAYQRSKKYALVRDHAYSDLSDVFVDAVHDAHESGDYLSIIETFGTHYPYAVTYGTSGRLSTYMTEETFAENRSSFRRDAGSAGFSLGPLEVSANLDISSELQTGESTTTKYGETVFTAVGGNGSWDQNGFSAGEAPFPILTDMRPLDDLLSPIYFPGEPEIYETARVALASAIDTYLRDRPALDRTSRLDGIRAPARTHTYAMRVASLECVRAGPWEGTGNPVQIHGHINIRFPRGGTMMGSRISALHTKRDTNDDYVTIPCPNGEYALSDADSWREFTGTPEAIANAQYQIHVNLWEWDWGADAWDGQEHIRRTPSNAYGIPRLNKGQKKMQRWAVPPADPGMPRLRVNVEFKRTQ